MRAFRGWPIVLALAGLLVLGAPPVGAQTGGEPETDPPDVLLLPDSEEDESGVIRAPATPAATPAPRIVAVEIRSDDPVSRSDLASYVTFSAGDRYDEDAVRRTLSNLYATGLVARSTVYTRPVDGGVEVVLALWSNVLVDQVRLEAPWKQIALDKQELRDVLAIRPGDPLIESRIVRTDFQLEERLAEQGYRDARVNFTVDVVPNRHRAEIVYTIEPGPRWSIGALVFEGDLGPFTAQRLRDVVRLEAGDPYRAPDVERTTERLQQFLIDQKHTTAEVETPLETFREEARRVDLVYTIEAGPRIEIEVEGAEISRLRKQGFLPFITGEAFDEALLLQAEDRIRTFFQEQGHYRVEVTHREEPLPGYEGGRRIVLEVDKGPEFRLEEIRFEGNEEVSEETLRGLMETSDDLILGLGPGRLVSEVLSEDLANIRSYYALDGYRGVEVGPEEIRIEDRRIFLTIPIDEGERRTVSALTVEGIEAFSPDQVRSRLELEEGGPYHPSLLEDSLDDIRSLYESEGYATAQVTVTERWNEARTEVALDVDVSEGPRQLLDRILIRGNRRTADFVIRHALDVEPGEPISRGKVLEMERNLYQLGIFSRAEVELTPADLGTSLRDVVVRVEEGRTRSLSVGLGYELDSDSSEGRADDDDGGPRASLGYIQRNVLGRGYRFLTDGSIGEEETRFRMVFEQPFIKLLPVSMLYEAFKVDEDRESFDAVRWIGRVETYRDRGPWRLSLAFDYRLIEADSLTDNLLIFEELPDDSDETPQVLGIRPGVLSPLEQDPEDPLDPSAQVASLFSGLFVDRRDDAVSPTEGWSLSTQVQYAFPLAAAEAEFVELFLQETHYVPLGGLGVLASSVRLGAIEPLQSVPGSARDPALAIPLDERFFSGGRTTHRAFDRFELGIRGTELTGRETLLGDGPNTSAPVGGNGLALVNLEYRFPVFGPVGGTVFTDWGQVWRDWRDFDPGDMRLGAGIGVRYQSPIGPLRLDVGCKLDGEGEEHDCRANFVFGNPF